MSDLPSGTITFLLTDVQDSTMLWENYAQAMGHAMAEHDQIIEQAVHSHEGVVVRPRGEGDSRFAVFEDAAQALRAAVTIQRGLESSFSEGPLQIKVRTGLHTGSAGVRAGDYYGTAVNLCARIRGLGHGGQTLLSEVTAALVRDNLPAGIELIDLGSYHLKGLSRAEKIFQLSIEGLRNTFPTLQSQESVAGNLPEPPTNFIGRQAEVDSISRRLLQDEVRLLTLTGPGGTGKTRLCLEIGRKVRDHYPDGVFFVDLAPLVDPDLTATTIARTLGIREGGGRPPLENLIDYLAGKEMLLILDNFEQIIDAAPQVSQLMAAAAKTNFLVSSRIALTLRGEQEMPISPLSLPKSGAIALEDLTRFEAVQLFIDRARAVRPAFALNEENALAVQEICRRLDGLPLAIEIAAARMRILTPQAILKRLDESLKLLVGGPADLPSRQQTMRNVVGWSYDLLDEETKTLFQRLSVFVSGFTFESAEAVCNEDGRIDMFSAMETLVRNNLVRQVDSVSDEPRFDMLVTIREYAAEKLREAGRAEELQQKHAEYFGRVSEDVIFFTGDSTYWLKRVEEEHDNFRAALSFSLANLQFLEIAVRICGHLAWFWYRYGHFQEGRNWSERALAVAQQAGQIPHGLSLMSAAMMAMWQGDLAVAAQRGELALNIFKKTELEEWLAQAHFIYGVILISQGRDSEAYPNLQMAAESFDTEEGKWFQSTVLVHLANVALGLGLYKDALSMLQKALPLAQEMGDPWQIAFSYNNFGELARTLAEYEKAEAYYLKTAQYFREADAASDQARLTYALASIAQHKQQYAQADSLYQQSLQAFRELGNKRGIAECLAGLACLAAEQGDGHWALPLYSAAERLITSFGGAWWPADRADYERALDLVRGQLSAEDYHRLREKGQAMDMQEALAYLSGEGNANSGMDITPPQ